MAEYKQVIVLREDLAMSGGKSIAQACHASLGAYRKTDSSVQDSWERTGQRKVVLEVESEKQLKDVYRKANNAGLPTYIVEDAGRTELEPGTATCVGIGPAESSSIDPITGSFPTK